MTHTPGPHRAGRYSSMLGCPIMAQPDPSQNSIVICSVYGGMSDDLDARKVECEATAALYAAAPDLLAACQVAVALLPAYKDDDAMWACFTQMRAALSRVSPDREG